MLVVGTLILSSANYNYQNSIKYFAVCGKCGWVSAETRSESDALSMDSGHENAYDRHRCAVLSYNSASKDKWKVSCNKCNFISPATTNHSTAMHLKGLHETANDRHRCSTILQ